MSPSRSSATWQTWPRSLPSGPRMVSEPAPAGADQTIHAERRNNERNPWNSRSASRRRTARSAFAADRRTRAHRDCTRDGARSTPRTVAAYQARHAHEHVTQVAERFRPRLTDPPKAVSTPARDEPQLVALRNTWCEHDPRQTLAPLSRADAERRSRDHHLRASLERRVMRRGAQYTISRPCGPRERGVPVIRIRAAGARRATDAVVLPSPEDDFLRYRALRRAPAAEYRASWPSAPGLTIVNTRATSRQASLTRAARGRPHRCREGPRRDLVATRVPRQSPSASHPLIRRRPRRGPTSPEAPRLAIKRRQHGRPTWASRLVRGRLEARQTVHESRAERRRTADLWRQHSLSRARTPRARRADRGETPSRVKRHRAAGHGHIALLRGEPRSPTILSRAGKGMPRGQQFRDFDRASRRPRRAIPGRWADARRGHAIRSAHGSMGDRCGCSLRRSVASRSSAARSRRHHARPRHRYRGGRVRGYMPEWPSGGPLGRA